MDVGIVIMILAIAFIIILAVWAILNYMYSKQSSKLTPLPSTDTGPILWQLESWVKNILSRERINVPFKVVTSNDYTYSIGHNIHVVIHRENDRLHFHDINVILLATIHEICHVIQYDNERQYGNSSVKNEYGSYVTTPRPSTSFSGDRNCEGTVHDAHFNDMETKLVQTAVDLKYLDLDWLRTYYQKKENKYPCYSS